MLALPLRNFLRSRRCATCGRINTLWVMLLAATGTATLLVAMLWWGGRDARDPTKLVQVYCAAGMRPAMEEIAANYKAETGIDIEFQFGGSNTLLNQIEINKIDTADLYLAADDFYVDAAVEKGLAAEILPIAHQRPVLVVKRDADVNIDSLEELLRSDLAIALGDPEQAAVGRAVKKQLSQIPAGETDRWQQLEQRITKDGVFKPTVNETANDVKVGAADAAIVWDSTAAMPQYRDVLKAIEFPELETDPNLISICVLNSSRNPTAALKFARYVAAIDKGLQVFEKFGTKPVAGDVWAERPKITFFCGAVNRLAVEKIVEDFEKHEGVEVDDIYNGCGMLTGNMKLINEQRTDLGFPDVYMACDVYYLENVKQWFQEAHIISETEMVIAVPKGSDKVKSLNDLLKPGVRVAVGQPEHCTIGALTQRMLAAEGLYERLIEKQKTSGEVVVELDSSARLIPQVVPIGSDTTPADVAIAYETDAKANADRVDIIHIDSPLNKAVQPFAISRTSMHKHLGRRLFRKIANSPEVFEAAGFRPRSGEFDTGDGIREDQTDDEMAAKDE